MYIGIDLGTSSVKSILADEQQKVLGARSVEVSIARPQEGWSEQNPEEWYAAVISSIDQLAGEFPDQMAEVRGIGLSGHMHGMTLLDKDGNVLRPAILWNDGRSSEECRELESACSRLVEITGNLIMPGFTSPKVAWVRKHEPLIYDKISKVLLPKDYIRWRLSGEFVSDMSDSSGTVWLDVAKRDWSDEALAASGLDRSHMPSLVEGTEQSAELSPELCRQWGIRNSVAIAGGGGDNAAAACGLGAIEPGDAFLTLGTSGVLWTTGESFRPAPGRGVHAFCHAIPETWHQMAVILSAMDSLNWISEISGKSPKELCAPLAGDWGEPGEIMFHPYLSGERTPHNNADARGAFAGISRSHGLVDLTKAVLEGIALAIADCKIELCDAGAEFNVIPLVGGGANIAGFPAMLASALNCSIALPEDGEYGAALGAARLGMSAAGKISFSDIFSKPAFAEIYEPDKITAERYSEKLERFRTLYKPLNL